MSLNIIWRRRWLLLILFWTCNRHNVLWSIHFFIFFFLQSWGDITDLSQAIFVYTLMAGSVCLYCWLGDELSEQVRRNKWTCSRQIDFSSMFRYFYRRRPTTSLGLNKVYSIIIIQPKIYHSHLQENSWNANYGRFFCNASFTHYILNIYIFIAMCFMSVDLDLST
jgi:hypothetical protein